MRIAIAWLLCSGVLLAAGPPKFEYRVLATTKTSTMEKELNEAADAGYIFSAVMGGESAFGGKEVIIVMAKDLAAPDGGKRKYKLLATSKTGTMQKELSEAGAQGFDYCGQTVFSSGIAGQETAVILEQKQGSTARIDFRLLATSRTSTMEKELRESGDAGYEFLGVAVGKTAFGGKEVVSILRRYAD